MGGQKNGKAQSCVEEENGFAVRADFDPGYPYFAKIARRFVKISRREHEQGDLQEM